MTDGMDIMIALIEKADQIEKTKQGKALTEDEARTLSAASLLRRICQPPTPRSTDA